MKNLVGWATPTILFFTFTSATFAQPLRTQKGMVVSAHLLASDAGVEMLKQGGNAIDAAVATAFAISVVEPFSAGIGGGGFAMVRLTENAEIKALDFRERAPQKATQNMYLDAEGKVRPKTSINGHLAVGVPGTVAGLYEMHRQYGKLPWKTVVKPAFYLAKDGFLVGEKFVNSVNAHKEILLANPAAKEIFTRNGQMWKVGDRLIQRDLAKTLQAISVDPQSFYRGEIAEKIAVDMQQNNGIITLEDLQEYNIIWRQPVCGMFRIWEVCSMPPPSSGGVHLLQILNIVGDTDIKSWGRYNPDTLHLLIEAMKIAYADRSEYLGDSDFVPVPVAGLINPEYGNLRRAEIDMNRAKSSSEVRPVDINILQQFTKTESEDTTHLTVVDEQKNVVSLTFTINGRFGAGVVAAGTGILLNNEMDDFAIAPNTPNLFGLVGGSANAIAPNKTPLSSMTPTIVLENNQFKMAVGSPGGSTIITTVLQMVLNVLVYEMDAKEAISAPRLHHQWMPDKLWVEKEFESGVLAELTRRGNEIEELPGWGNANLIIITPDGQLEGAADPRGEGAARGY
ncbi:gamma-glutamyltransferase [Ancylothrix sp. C2]|uniref:gamma-glutamyltransferase n=1 Tax=Ancylothrix sp. D3o TaxID=2953691 RepID=UPI0021BB04B1|nr:gamma-glutamyltransferase [Ancylothrix sp. D3o]MCT7952099.1 gamma-glutamyltransferase [Ancylothrix sp. D3o]